MTIMILLISTFITLQAPITDMDEKSNIEKWNAAEQIWIWQPLIDAVVWVESRGDTFAFNEKEMAVGAFQIRQCRVDHYRRLTGLNYTLEDFFDYDLSREMFEYFARDKTFKQAAKDWNGSGPLTEIYWKKVKTFLYGNN